MTAATPRAHHAFARSDRTAIGVWWWTVDRWMLGVVAILIAIGVVMSFAASPAAAVRMNIGDPFHFAVRQCVFAAGAAVILIVVSMLDVKNVRRSAFFIWLIAIAIMIALPFIGHNAKGATRWLEFGGFTFQPSEYMKPALIILVAWMFAEGQKGEGVPGVSIAFVLYFISIGLLLIQPDVGQTVLITIAFGAAFWMAGVPLSWVMLLGAAAAGLEANDMATPTAISSATTPSIQRSTVHHHTPIGERSERAKAWWARGVAAVMRRLSRPG